ncbi:MAG: hypothetical protein V1820_01780 [archaeon]
MATKMKWFFLESLVTAAVAMTGLVFLFVYAILGALFGAVAGWFVQIAPVIGPAVRAGFGQLGLPVTDLTTVGAALGFVSGFFKNNSRETGGRIGYSNKEEW